MKTEKLSEMIARTRRIRSRGQTVERSPAMPLGLAKTIVRVNCQSPDSRLLRFQNWSFGGLGVAALIALAVLFLSNPPAPEIASSHPTEPWMEMSMNQAAP